MLGVLNGIWRPAETLLDSSLQMLRNVPHLAIIPLVILWFGIDEAAKIFLVVIGVLFPIYLNTFHGIRTVDRGPDRDGARLRPRPRALFWRVILPGALPSILVGLRYALGIMWLTLIVAETISASSGIGYMTMNAREFLQTDVVLLGIIVYALLGKLADVLDARARAARARLASGLSALRSDAMSSARSASARCRGASTKAESPASARTGTCMPSRPAGSGSRSRFAASCARFGERGVLHGPRPGDPGRPVRRHRRPLRRRQDHAHAPDRRPRRTDRRASPRSAASRSRPAARRAPAVPGCAPAAVADA